MTISTVTDLMRNLNEEDARIFDALAETDWGIYRESGQLVWRNFELNEMRGPFDDDKDVIAAAHELYKSGNGSRPAGESKQDAEQPEEALEPQEPTLPAALEQAGWQLIHQNNVFFCKNPDACIRTNIHTGAQEAIDEAVQKQAEYAEQFAPVEEKAPVEGFSSVAEVAAKIVGEEDISDAELHKREAHEVDLDTALIKFFNEEGVAFLRNVEVKDLVADLVTDDAIYLTKCTLTAETLPREADTGNSIWRYLQEEEKVSSDAQVIIVTCCTENLAEIKTQADNLAVRVLTLEEITTPCTGEFFDALISEVAAADTIDKLADFIRENGLENIESDERFTPSQRRRLEEAINQTNERVYAALETKHETDEATADAAWDDLREENVPQADANLFGDDGAASHTFLAQQMVPQKLSTHPSLLMRAQGLDEEYVRELEQGFRAGATFPPADIFFDGEHYWVADGNHRAAGAARAGAPLDVRIHKGTLRDAMLFALKANTEHGLKLTNDDKRLKAVTMLADSELFRESDSILATLGGVTQPFISSVRRDLRELLPFEPIAEDDLAAQLDGTALGRLRSILSHLPKDELETLTQNVLSDDGRRRGADNVVRSVPAKASEAEESTAPLFAEPAEEAAEVSSATEEESVEVETEPHTGAIWDTVHIVNTLKAHEGKLSRLELEERGCSYAAILNAVGEGAIAQPETGIFTLPPVEGASVAVAANTPATPSAPVATEVKEHTPAERPAPPAQPARPSIENLLGDKMLVITYTYMKFLPGKVTVSVRVGDDATQFASETLDASLVRNMPERVIEMITWQIKASESKAVAAKASQAQGKAPSKTAAKAPAKKSAAKKAPAEKATKKPATSKKSAKKPTAKQGARAGK